MASIRKRKKKDGTFSYTATIRIKGSKEINATFNRLTDAKLWVQEKEPLIKKGKYLTEYEASKHTLSELIDRYKKIELPKRNPKAQKKQNMHLDWWQEQIGDFFLSKITPALLSEYKEKLITERSDRAQKGRTTRTGATANRYMASLSIVLTIACNEWQWIDENPMLKVKKFKETPKKDRFLSEEEINRLLKACFEFDLRGENYNRETYLFILIALTTGARYSEIHNLQWKNLDFKNRNFYFLETKNGENRGVPMVERVYKELLEFKKIRNIKNDYLWTTKNGKNLIDMHVRFYKVLEIAQIEDFRFHDIRHTVASHIAMSGGSLLDISQILGHKTMQMVKRYSHLTQSHAAKRLEITTNEMFKEVEL